MAGLPVLATEAQFQAFSSKVDNGGLVLWPQLWTEIRQYYSDPSPVPAAPAAPSPAVIASSTSPASSAWSELTVKAVFSKYDSGGGFIPTESLRAVLNDLGPIP